MRASLVAAAIAAVALALAPLAVAHACAGCRNPNLPQTRTDAGPVEPGSVSLQMVAATTHVRVTHDAGCVDLAECDEVTIQPQHTHDLTMVPVQLEPRLAVGVSERVALEVGVPLRLVSSRVSYQTPSGEPYTPVDAGVHHRDEVRFGLGDMEVAARSTWQAGRWWLTGRVGARLPTGRTEEDPFALGDAGIRHQHIQFGSGTVDPQLGFDATWSDTRMEWSLYGQGGLSLYDNRHGFRGPARGLFGVSNGWKLGRVTVLGASVEAALEGAERWQGEVRQDASLGRRELMLGPHLSWRRGMTATYLATRFVVFRDIVEGDEDPGKLRAPVTVSLAVSWSVR